MLLIFEIVSLWFVLVVLGLLVGLIGRLAVGIIKFERTLVHCLDILDQVSILVIVVDWLLLLV